VQVMYLRSTTCVEMASNRLVSTQHGRMQQLTDLATLEPEFLANLAVCFQAYLVGRSIFLLAGLVPLLAYFEVRVGRTVS
jgi:hypothetical protein